MRKQLLVSLGAVSLVAAVGFVIGGCASTSPGKKTSTPVPAATTVPTSTPTITPTPMPTATSTPASLVCDNFESGSWGSMWTHGNHASASGGCTAALTTPCTFLTGTNQFVEAAAAYAGAFGVRLGLDVGAGATVDCMATTVAIPSTGTYTLSFWYRHYSGDYPPYDWFQVRIYDSTCTTLLATPVCNMAPSTNACDNVWDSGWTQSTTSLASYAGQTITIWFGSYEDGSCSPSYAYIDSFCIN